MPPLPPPLLLLLLLLLLLAALTPEGGLPQLQKLQAGELRQAQLQQTIHTRQRTTCSQPAHAQQALHTQVTMRCWIT
jgi:hypothetical protein